ncbi:MAG: sigma-70 family RNA polymerase sigma factor [Planctomycetota bacterium]
MEPIDDVIRSATAGEPAAIDALLARYLPSLQAFLRLRAGRLLLNRESTSDLAQSVCRDILENASRFRFDGEDGFRRWLFTTALRKIADRHEYWLAACRDVNRQVAPAPATSDDERLDDCRAFYTPSRQAIAREELARAEAALGRLSDEQREVVLMAKVLGLSRAAIAEQIGKSEGAVRNILYRALAEIAEEIGGQD